MALQRQNVFPKGDLALAIAVQKVKKLPTRPKPKELEAIRRSLALRDRRKLATLEIGCS